MQISSDDGLVGTRGLALFGVVLGLAALWAVSIGLGKAVRRRLRYLTRDPRRTATASRKELEAFLRDQRLSVPGSATLDDLREAVSEGLRLDGRAFVDAAARARFGPPTAARGNADLARQELRLLVKRMRRELTVWARARGFVSLRSLGRGWQA